MKIQRRRQNFAEQTTPNGAFASPSSSADSMTVPAPTSKGWAIQSVLLILVLALGACDLGGGSGGGSPSSAASGPAISPVLAIDLPAGQTQAILAWNPSAGNVESYQVYESLNGGDYTFVATVNSPQVTISGSDGDAVRISVLAVNTSGRPSNSSPPSPEMRFHAADPGMVSAAVAVNDPALTNAPPSAVPNSIEPTATAAVAATTSEPVVDVAADTTADAAPNDSTNASAAAEDSSTLDATLREMLVRSDARFGITGLSEAAQTWLQDRVEEQFNAGVQLVGTGELDQDGLRELIWQDPAGQLFVSTGLSVIEAVETSDLPSTFVEGLRLQTTERFVALADLTGDGVGEWIVEDASMGDVWIIDAVSHDIVNARGDQTMQITGQLVGHGDFNADGRDELVWQQPNGQLTIESPYDNDFENGASAVKGSIEIAETSQLVTIADSDGDGRDDLLTIDENGRLEWMLASSLQAATQDGTNVQFESRLGPDLSSEGLELVVTLDTDPGNGQSEIVWFNGTTIEIWNAETGPL